VSTVSHAPRFSPARAEALAREHFGLAARAEGLPSERDLNFLLTTAEGSRFVLKLANRSEDPAVLELQNAAMLHLAALPDGPACSRVLPNGRGEYRTAVTDEEGAPSCMRLVSYIEGVPLGRVRPQAPELLFDLGRFLGRLSCGLAAFHHPAARRPLIWDMRTGPETVGEYLPFIADDARRALVRGVLKQFDAGLRAKLGALDAGVVHNDANDFNVIVTPPAAPTGAFGARTVAGLIDFGDMVHSWRLAEPAVACAYVMLGKDDPLAAAARVAAGYHSVVPLSDAELDVLFHLIRLRLIMSVAICAYQTHLRPDNAYLAISNEPAWETLGRLSAVRPEFASYIFRAACGKVPCPESPRVVEWLRARTGSFAPVAGFPLQDASLAIFDLSVGSPMIDNPGVIEDTKAFSDLIFSGMRKAGAAAGVGKYDEARLVYTSPAFRPPGRPLAEGRTVHIGLDLFLVPGSPVFAPLDGIVHSFHDNAARLDYGPTVILEHRPGDDAPCFYTLYGHLSPESLDGLEKGRPVRRGERIAAVGAFPRNGDWPPHLHFQVILDMLGLEGDFPGVARAGERDVWLSLCPDPNLILGIPAGTLSAGGPAKADILARRRTLLGKSLSVSYRRPLEIVRGFRQWLYDETGRMFLDGVNNVPHVGHSHPRVVEAVRRQVAVLNTNTRYLHETIIRYAERLTATLPAPLRVCYFVNSGSEANDLALRLARTFTGRRDMIAVASAYHGHLTSLIEISSYKFDGPGGQGRPPFTQVAVLPDLYRGPYRYGDPEAGAKYAAHVRDAIARIRREGREAAGFICESLLSCGGQIVLPDGYLAEAFRAVREAGGLCIADEVQVGFGRVGSHFWGFETQGVVPDIVTMGKPIGNGFPLAAVVTTPEISAAFANGMEYFNTYGGNPVACAAGLAVLDVMRDEKLQESAASVGARLKAGLERLKRKHPLVGDVRGLGLFLGVELVLDRTARTPATREAAYIVDRLRDAGILISSEGPDHNVLKIKPPLVFDASDADLFGETLDAILAEDPVARRG
jgi:4-aminobutyrate aminotransferase-like enzyme/Ser/Thr protein kinase RdoA (MazF antagonist)